MYCLLIWNLQYLCNLFVFLWSLSLALTQSEKVPDWDWAVCWHSDDLALVWAPLKSLDRCRVAQSLSKEGELVQSLQLVDKDFVCFCAKGHEFAWWANLQVGDLVRVGDLGDRLSLVTIPEEDRAARSSRYQLKLVVLSLAHSCVESVLSLTHLHTLLLL